MLHEIQELEARVLKLDRAVQSFSLAKTVLPAIHRSGLATHAEIFSADETLDAIEQKIGELAELTRQLTVPLASRKMPYRRRQSSLGEGTTRILTMGTS